MTPLDVDAARQLLRAHGQRAVVFGSFGLLLHGVYDAALVPDVDVIAALDDAIAIGAALAGCGFALSSWQELLAPHELTRARLAGRIYLRARRASLVCDVSYEGFDATEWRSDAADIEGITVAAVARIERQRAHKRASR